MEMTQMMMDQMPLRYEFWRHRPFRLHDRRVFVRNSLEHKDWQTERLYP